MTKFNVGDILANYSGGLDKPAYQVVDNTNGVYRLRQIPSGNYFTWDYATVERANALYIAPTPPPVTCTGGSPHYGTGGALLRHFDADNDGIISKDEWWAAEELMMHGEITEDEFGFVLQAYHAGSINAKCPGCYTPPDPCAGVTCPNGCWGTSLYSKKCVDGHCVKDALIKSNAPECGYTPPVTCTGGSPHYGNGGALLRHFDADNDGKVTSSDALRARNDGMTAPEVQFILSASAAGSINAKCPGCYTPPDPCAGVTCSNICDGTSLYSQKCVDGQCVKDALIKSNAPECGYVPPVTCTGGSPHYGTGGALLRHFDADNDGIISKDEWWAAEELMMHGEITEDEFGFVLQAYHAGSINAKCPGCYTPTRVCTEGTKRSPETCWDGSVIYKEVCRGNAWVPTGEKCLTKPAPECTEGDKKPGYVCSGGKWISTMPGPVHGEPSTIEAPEIIPGIKPPRIPLLTPELAKIPLLPGWVIRDADGRIVAGRAPDTIEFQEIVPGIKPPRVPQLIPSLETLPMLPGWTIRNREGTIVAHGAHLPTIGTEEP